MNKATRKEIDSLVQRINSLETGIKIVETSGDNNDDMIDKLIELTDEANDIQNDIQYLADEEQNKYDSLPENLQWSERGETFEEAANALFDAAGIDDSPFQEIIEAIKNGEDPNWDVDFSEFTDSLLQAQSV